VVTVRAVSPLRKASTGPAPASGLPPLRTVTVAVQAVAARRPDGGAARVTVMRGGAASEDVAASAASRVTPMSRRRRTTRTTRLARLTFPRLPAKPSSGHDRTSVLVFIKDQPGALFNVLSPFARHGISMNRIESRPSHQAKWEYGFFIDLAGHIDDVPMKKALADLEKHAAQIKLLGSYPVAVL